MCQLRVTFLYGTTRNPKQKKTHTFRHGRTNGKSIRVMMMMPACLMQTLGKFFVSMRCATTLILYFNFFFSLLSCIVIHNTAVLDSYSAFLSIQLFSLFLSLSFAHYLLGHIFRVSAAAAAVVAAAAAIVDSFLFRA